MHHLPCSHAKSSSKHHFRSWAEKPVLFSAVNLVNSPFLGSAETLYELAVRKVCNFQSIKAENI